MRHKAESDGKFFWYDSEQYQGSLAYDADVVFVMMGTNDRTDKHLYILWTNADPRTSQHMVFMYASNSMRNGWWDRVTVVVWGPTQTLLVEDEEVRAAMEDARGLGVEFSACLTCADKLGLTKELEDMGLEVVRWGKRLSGLLQSGAHVITV